MIQNDSQCTKIEWNWDKTLTQKGWMRRRYSILPFNGLFWANLWKNYSFCQFLIVMNPKFLEKPKNQKFTNSLDWNLKIWSGLKLGFRALSFRSTDIKKVIFGQFDSNSIPLSYFWNFWCKFLPEFHRFRSFLAILVKSKIIVIWNSLKPIFII